MGYKTKLIELSLLALSFAAHAAISESDLRIIVKAKPQLSSAFSAKKALSRALNLPVNSITPIAGDAYLLTINGQELNKNLNTFAALLSYVRKNPDIIYAVKDRVGYFKPVPNPDVSESDIFLNHELQWDEFAPPGGIMLETAAGLRDAAWAYTTGMAAKPIVVAVLDTGIAKHESLLNNLVKDEQGQVWGWNFAANNRNLDDETRSYHGTHVAGTIASFGNVTIGVGEHLKILPVKIPDSSGMFYESQVINAIYWSVGGNVPGAPANPYPAKVLNMSFGIDERPGKEIDHCDEALQEAIKYVKQQGAVITVAAGNDDRWENYNAPAICNGTIKVASTGPKGIRAYYSNYGPGVSFAAPGGDLYYGKQGGILSTVNPNGGYQKSGFDFYQGTSMASPHAAGVAGLVFAISDGAISPEKVEQILYATTHAFGQTTNENKSCMGKKPCGHGILDAENAVKAAMANYDVIITAPMSHDFVFSACKGNGFQGSLANKQSVRANWLVNHPVCQSKESYQEPQLEETKTGKILAHYGRVNYVLDTTGFKHCQVIGNTGVGCYY